MNVVYLTTDDPLYLPALFEEVLSKRSDRALVLVVPPLYRGQSTRAAAWRYLRTFGWRATVDLASRTVAAKLRRQSIAAVCERHGIPCDEVADVNDPALLDRLEAMGTHVVVSVSCPQLFQQRLIDLPPLGCLNVHGAILPNYRGILPSFWMLANREPRAGVSIFFVDETVDGGDLCGQRVFDIAPTDTLDDLLRRSKAAAAELVVDVLGQIEDGTVSREPLDLTAGSYYSWPDRTAVRQFHEVGRSLW